MHDTINEQISNHSSKDHSSKDRSSEISDEEKIYSPGQRSTFLGYNNFPTRHDNI